MGDNYVGESASPEGSIKSDHYKVSDFDNFVPWACKQYSIDMNVVVTRSAQKAYVSAAGLQKKHGQKFKHSKVIQTKMRPEFDSDGQVKIDITSSSETLVSQENTLFVETVYEGNDNLVHVKFLKNRTIPRKVMKVVALTVPYQKYLTSVTINSGLNMESLYEISKFLPNSNITELCLDGTFLAKANYHLLLSNSKLKHLSLARCSINDTVVKTIMDQLADPHPASKVLSALNLSSNRITDVGAKYVAGMLRTNRQLSYLNLASNMLSDEGGFSILDTLQKFPLEVQEIFDCKMRHVAFLKKKKDLVNKLILELQNARESRFTKKKTVKKTKLDTQSLQNFGQNTFIDIDGQIMQDKAERLADMEMGIFDDHFSLNNTESKDGVLHCLGNNKLCYLNLAYNNLTHMSVTKLLDVLLMQKSLNRTPIGLIKVVIEGNLMPVTCEEYKQMDLLFESRLSNTKQTGSALKKKPLSPVSNVRSVK